MGARRRRTGASERAGPTQRAGCTAEPVASYSAAVHEAGAEQDGSEANARPRAHEPALDGLRGLAAFIVVLRHGFNAQIWPRGLRLALAQSPFAVLLNGQGAVQIFFVLSGFVLAGSLERSREHAPWPQFFVRRVFRIHPPYIVGVLVGLVPAALGLVAGAVSPLPPPPALPSAGALAGYLTFPGVAGGLLPVGWTLQIEMVFSLLLPLIVGFASIARGAPLVAVSTALLFGVEHDLAHYAIDFALGVVAYQQRAHLLALLARIGDAARAALVGAALVLWCAPLLFWPRIVRGYLIAGWFPYEIAVMAIGSTLLVICAVGVPFLRAWLSKPLCIFLGRISYASYLLHWTILALLAPHLVDRSMWGNAVMLVALVAATTLLSIPFHSYIERPAIALGNRACRALARRIGAPAIESRAGS